MILEPAPLLCRIPARFHTLQLVVVRHDVLVGAVGQAEAAGDDAQLGKAELLVKVAGHCVGGHDGVELQDSKAVRPALCEAVPHK